jgi:hypothetical protein
LRTNRKSGTNYKMNWFEGHQSDKLMINDARMPLG